jgi:hypothetical protein
MCSDSNVVMPINPGVKDVENKSKIKLIEEIFKVEGNPCVVLEREERLSEFNLDTLLSKEVDIINAKVEVVEEKCKEVKIEEPKISFEPEVAYESFELSAHNNSSIKEAIKIAKDLGILTGSNEDILFATRNVKEAFSTFTKEYGVEVANENSKDFKWDLSSLTKRNISGLKKHNYNLSNYAQSIFSERSISHLSFEKVQNMKAFDIGSVN